MPCSLSGLHCRLALLTLLLAGGLWSSTSLAQEPIGVVILAKGTVTAMDTLGNSRPLTRREPVYAGDTLVTETGSRVQVRMVDEAQYSLNASARFLFSTYNFDGDESTPDSALMELVAGCFRSISGQIGDQDHDVFRINTRAAWIGINGTVHGGCFDGSVLTTATREGGTTVTNEYGSVFLGINSAYDYSETVIGNAPAGVLDEPDAITNMDNDQRQPNISSSGALGPNPGNRVNRIGPPANTSPVAPQQDYEIIP